MKISELISILNKVQNVSGDIEVVASAFGGNVMADYHFSTFDFVSPKRKDFSVKNHINGLNQFSIGIQTTPSSKEDRINGCEQMFNLNYKYVPGQFIGNEFTLRIIDNLTDLKFNYRDA